MLQPRRRFRIGGFQGKEFAGDRAIGRRQRHGFTDPTRRVVRVGIPDFEFTEQPPNVVGFECENLNPECTRAAWKVVSPAGDEVWPPAAGHGFVGEVSMFGQDLVVNPRRTYPERARLWRSQGFPQADPGCGTNSLRVAECLCLGNRPLVWNPVHRKASQPWVPPRAAEDPGVEGRKVYFLERECVSGGKNNPLFGSGEAGPRHTGKEGSDHDSLDAETEDSFPACLVL